MIRLCVAILLCGMLCAAQADVVRDLEVPIGRRQIQVGDSVLRTEVHVWKFRARAGQSVSLRMTALEHNAVFRIWCPGAVLHDDAPVEGRLLAPATVYEDLTRWTGKLPETGTYLIVVGPTRGNATYKLALNLR